VPKGWKTVLIREEVYRVLKAMMRAEQRPSLANMNEVCILDYFSRHHRDLKVIA